jgi:hypothetical protein
MWLPTAIGAGSCVLLLLLVVWLGGDGGRPGPDDGDPGSDGGGGGGRRRPPPPPPGGPVTWAEFERQFAEFVAERAGGRAEELRPAAKDGASSGG